MSLKCNQKKTCGNPCALKNWHPNTYPHPCGSNIMVEARGYTVSPKLPSFNTRAYCKEVIIIGGANTEVKMHHWDEGDDVVVPIF